MSSKVPSGHKTDKNRNVNSCILDRNLGMINRDLKPVQNYK
jgi:hypothetical protein